MNKNGDNNYYEYKWLISNVRKEGMKWRWIENMF